MIHSSTNYSLKFSSYNSANYSVLTVLFGTNLVWDRLSAAIQNPAALLLSKSYHIFFKRL
jgi:hypothetical protein